MGLRIRTHWHLECDRVEDVGHSIGRRRPEQLGRGGKTGVSLSECLGTCIQTRGVSTHVLLPPQLLMPRNTK